MHIKANDPAMGPLKIPRGTAGPGQASVPHDDSPASLQQVDSPALSVQGQSWPYACNPEVATEISSGISQSLNAEVMVALWCCVLAETLVSVAAIGAAHKPVVMTSLPA